MANPLLPPPPPAPPGLFNLSGHPGTIATGNINLYNRPQVVNFAEGGMSTVFSTSFRDPWGREVLVPMVGEHGGIITPEQAMNNYYKTGRHLGIFSNPKDADSYAKTLHEEFATGRYDRPWDLIKKRLQPER